MGHNLDTPRPRPEGQESAQFSNVDRIGEVD